MHIPNIHNNIIDISSFSTGLNILFSSTGFYFKSKVIEGLHKRKNMFFNFWALLPKIYIFEVVIFLRLWHFLWYFWGCDIFLSPSGGPVNSSFQWHHVFIRSTFSMKHFSSYYQNVYGHQTLQGGDMLRGALTHKYTWYLNLQMMYWHHTRQGADFV